MTKKEETKEDKEKQLDSASSYTKVTDDKKAKADKSGEVAGKEKDEKPATEKAEKGKRSDNDQPSSKDGKEVKGEDQPTVDQPDSDESSTDKPEAGKEKKPKKKKKKAKRSVPKGRLYVHATFNNTIITCSDESGNVLAWETSGKAGFKGSRKSTPYAAQVAASRVADTVKSNFGMSKVDAFVKGIGSGRESAVRAFQNAGVYVSSIKDITPVPHNGCREKKPRRV